MSPRSNIESLQDMTDDCLRHVASLGLLRSLDLSSNPLVTDRGLAKLKGLLYLCELNLSYCDNVNDKVSLTMCFSFSCILRFHWRAFHRH